MKMCFAVSIFHLNDHGDLPAWMETQWNFVSFREAMGQLRWRKRRGGEESLCYLGWLQPGWRKGLGLSVPNNPWGPVWLFPHLPAGKPRGTSQEGPVVLGLSVLGCASCIQGCPFSSQQESSRNAPEGAGWMPRGTGMNSVSFWILVVRWLRVEGWAGFGSQRTFLLIPLGMLVTTVLCSRLCVCSGGFQGVLLGHWHHIRVLKKRSCPSQCTCYDKIPQTRWLK